MGLLKALVIGMGVLIVGGTVTLAVLIVQRAGGAAAPPPAELALRQPPGSRIGGLAPAGDRLAVWVTRPDGTDRLLLLDPRRGGAPAEVRLGD